MNIVGLAHVFSMLWLSGVVCFSISLNENRDPRRIVSETVRRWVKFMVVALTMMLVVQLLSC